MKKHSKMIGQGFRAIYGLSFGRAKRILRNKGFKTFDRSKESRSWDFETSKGQYARLFWDIGRGSYTVHHK